MRRGGAAQCEQRRCSAVLAATTQTLAFDGHTDGAGNALFHARGRHLGVVRRTHYCRRCGAAIDPGDVYAAVDVLDAEGRLRELLCRACGADLRAFVAGEGKGVEECGENE